MPGCVGVIRGAARTARRGPLPQGADFTRLWRDNSEKETRRWTLHGEDPQHLLPVVECLRNCKLCARPRAPRGKDIVPG